MKVAPFIIAVERLTPKKLTFEKSVEEKGPVSIAFVPDRFTPCVPSEKIVLESNWAAYKSEPMKLTPLRFTPRKSTLPVIPFNTALVSDRFTPCVPFENTVCALN